MTPANRFLCVKCPSPYHAVVHPRDGWVQRQTNSRPQFRLHLYLGEIAYREPRLGSLYLRLGI